MWNSRYAGQEFVYGKTPNKFLESHIDVFKPNSQILFAAEGEGRNAVFALKKGMKAVAVDYSEKAKNKALKLAAENLVQLDYHIGDLLEMDFPEEYFDGIVLIYAHFPSQVRKKIHQKLQKLLKPNAILLLESFSKNHLEVSKNNLRTSGPQNIDMLYTVDLLKEDFNEVDFSLALEESDVLAEGAYHEGNSSLIRMIGTKNENA